jgi:hypothetical protein
MRGLETSKMNNEFSRTNSNRTREWGNNINVRPRRVGARRIGHLTDIGVVSAGRCLTNWNHSKIFTAKSSWKTESKEREKGRRLSWERASCMAMVSWPWGEISVFGNRLAKIRAMSTMGMRLARYFVGNMPAACCQRLIGGHGGWAFSES